MHELGGRGELAFRAGVCHAPAHLVSGRAVCETVPVQAKEDELLTCSQSLGALQDGAEFVQKQLQDHLGHSTWKAGIVEEAEVQDFLDFWCEADFSMFMSPERAVAALDVQRKLRECQGRTGDAVSEVATSVGSEGSCSSRSSSGSSSRRLLPPRGLGLLDPLADLLTAGDEPAFVAHARKALPSDWLQRTFRQQKRFLGKLRRSHFGGKRSGDAKP